MIHVGRIEQEIVFDKTAQSSVAFCALLLFEKKKPTSTEYYVLKTIIIVFSMLGYKL